MTDSGPVVRLRGVEQRFAGGVGRRRADLGGALRFLTAPAQLARERGSAGGIGPVAASTFPASMATSWPLGKSLGDLP